MQFDEMRRRQHAIASSRNRQSNSSSRSSRGGNNILTKMTGTTRKKFSLLLPQITAPSPHYPRHEYETSPVGRGGGGGRGRWWTTTPWSLKCACVLLAPFLLLMSYYSGRYSQQQRLGAGVSGTTTSTVRGKYWRSANVSLESSNNTNNTALPQLIAGGTSSNDDDLIYNENDEAADEEQQTMPNDFNTIHIDNQEEEGGVTVVVKNKGEEQTTSKNENDSPPTVVVVVVQNNMNESSFKYVGTLDSTIPNPWPNTEIDWWYMHNKLVSRVQSSDNDNTNYNLQEKKKDEEEEQEEEEEEEEEDEQKMIILPQLIFIGDSITEGWEGTSLGQIPQGTRGWGDDPTNEIHAIRTIFDTNFGTTSNYWGKYAWKLPLVLGIGGSRTDDLLWRLANGEFPRSVRRQQRQQQQQQQQQQRSKIMDGKDDNVVSTTADTKEIMENESDVQSSEENDDEDYEEEDEEEDNEIEVNIADNNPHRKMETPTKTMKEQMHDTKSFQVDQLERIYIVLIGTNNLGGGMTPHQTIRGIDAVGRMIYKLHLEKYYTAIISSSSSSNSTNELLDELTPPPPPVAIVLSELLPRYDSQRAIKMCPPKCKNNITLESYTTFMPAIDAVNRALPDVVDGWRKDFINSRIVLLSSSINTDEDVGNDDYDSNSSSSRSSRKDESNDNDGATSDVVKNDYTHRIECGREMFIFDDESEFEIYMPDR